MRYTTKVENENNYCLASSNYSDDLSRHNIESAITIDKSIDKLGQLEDILEEYDMDNMSKLQIHLELLREFTKLKNELGIDLIILFKALTNGVYRKTKNDIVYYASTSLQLMKRKEWYLYHLSYTRLKLKHYGKTWALTKEELL